MTLERLTNEPLRALQYLMVMEQKEQSPTLGSSLGRGGFSRGALLSPPSNSPNHSRGGINGGGVGYLGKSRDPVRRCVSDDLDSAERPRASSGGGTVSKLGSGMFSGKRESIVMWFVLE